MLSGPEKAVIFLLSLDEDVARPIVGELSESELRKLRSVAATMREVPGGAIEDAYKEFLQRSKGVAALPHGGLPYLRKLSARAIGEERTANVFEDGVTTPFARLEGAAADTVASLLEAEPPQLVAAVLGRLEPIAAASILAAMPRERQTAIVRHVSRMTQVPANVLEEVANAIVSELPTDETSTIVTVDGVARAAAMLNAVGRDATEILGGLDEIDPVLASEVRQAMFTFDDLRNIESRSMREILRSVAGDRLTLALKDAAPEVVAAIFAGLSDRAAALIRDDLEIMGKVKRSEIEAARKEIIEAALKLEAEGKVDLGREAPVAAGG